MEKDVGDTHAAVDRRAFLAGAGKFALVTPPVMTMLLSTSLSSPAIAASGVGGYIGGGDGSGGSAGSSGASGSGDDHDSWGRWWGNWSGRWWGSWRNRLH